MLCTSLRAKFLSLIYSSHYLNGLCISTYPFIMSWVLGSHTMVQTTFWFSPSPRPQCQRSNPRPSMSFFLLNVLCVYPIENRCSSLKWNFSRIPTQAVPSLNLNFSPVCNFLSAFLLMAHLTSIENRSSAFRDLNAIYIHRICAKHCQWCIWKTPSTVIVNTNLSHWNINFYLVAKKYDWKPLARPAQYFWYSILALGLTVASHFH